MNARTKLPAPKTDLTAWKAQLLKAADELLEMCVDAEGLASDLPHKRAITGAVAEPQSILLAWQEIVQDQEPTIEAAKAWINRFSDVEDQLLYAAALVQRPGPRAVIQAAQDECGRILVALREAVETQALPSIGVDAFEWHQQHRGMCILADLIEVIYSLGDEYWLDAASRGRGVTQDRSAVENCLAQLQYDHGAQAGFAAGLTTLIAVGAHSSWTGVIEDLRIMTREEYCGGPDTKYIGEESEEVGTSAGPANAAADEGKNQEPVYTDPLELCANSLLDKLLMYLMESLEIVSTPDGAHAALHEHVWESYGLARKALEQHASADQIVSAICMLRDGFEVFLPLVEGSAALPIVRECIALIERFLDAGNDGGDGGAQPEPPGGGSKPSPAPAPAEAGFPGADRIELARQGATYICRIVGHFQAATRQGTMGDLDAIGKAASMILSAVDDPVVDVESLEDRLDDALTSASVVFAEQPPRYWKAPSGAKKRAVVQEVVPAMGWN